MNIKTIIAAIVLMTAAQYSFAQGRGKVSLAFTGGYVFQERMDFGTAYGYIEEGAVWGGALEYHIDELTGVELMYRRQDTHAPLYDIYYGTEINEPDDAALNYVILGGNRYFPVNHTFAGYGGLGLGLCVLSDKKDYSITRMAWEMRLGAKINASESVAFKFQAQLTSIVQGVGANFYFGTGGAGYGVSTYSSIYQFGFTGGLVFTF